MVGVLSFTSCDETESPIYDGFQTLGYFSSLSGTSEININESVTVDIPVAVTTLSTVERTLSVSVVEEDTTAPDGTYSFSTVTIPANEYFGTLALTATANGFAQNGANIGVQINSVSDGGVGSPETYLLRLLQVCPIDATFATGMYNVSFVSGGIPAAGNAPALGDAMTVELLAGTTSTERIFNVKFYPSLGLNNPPADFSFNLVCGTTITNGIVEGQVSAIGCAGGSIAYTEADEPGTYTVGDDTSLSLIFTEDSDAICGAPGVTTYTLTKI